MRCFIYLSLLILFLPACNQYAATNRVYKKQTKEIAKEIRRQPSLGTSRDWVGTTNFGVRRPDFVVIHHTAQSSCPQTLQTFTTPRTQVSAHYVICRDGTIYHMLNDYLRAWHAGISAWGNNRDINSCSIGIELDNDGEELFPEEQIVSLMGLLDTLKKKYSIADNNFVGHGDIAPGRKVDPNVNFPWERLSEQGFGLWYGDTTNLVLPDNFNPLTALRIIGYTIADSSATMASFKRHFLHRDDEVPLSEGDLKIMYDLMLKSM